MKFLIILLALTLQITAVHTFAQTVVSKAGREILLNEDGTWEYLSEDTLIETKDGLTARLKPDNTWEYIGNAPVKEEGRHRELGVDIELLEVFINEAVSSAGSASKNKRRSAEINFKIQVALTPNSSKPLSISALKENEFFVSDNRGKTYEIASISGTVSEIKPGEQSVLTIKTKSAPSLLYAPKSLYLDIASDTLATDQKVRLEKLYGTIERKRKSG